MNPTLTTQHLPPEAVHRFLKHVPDYVKAALIEKSAELDCLIAAIVEMAGSFAVPKATPVF